MTKAKTQREFLLDLKEVHKDKITTKDEYINSSTKLSFICSVCGNIWKTIPNSILHGTGCPRCCINKRTKTPKAFLLELKEIHGDMISTKDSYTNNHTKMLFYCSICGNTWKASPNSVLGGSGCPRCSYVARGKAKAKKQEEFLQELTQVQGTKITTTDTYVNNHTKMMFHCNLCNNTWKSVPSNLLRGCDCPKCSGRVGKTQAEFLEELDRIHGSLVSLDGAYKGSHFRTKFRCNLCGGSWTTFPYSILCGTGCPNCSSSSGEQLVRTILEYNSIDYDPQHSFTIKGRTHRLDVVLKDKDSTWCIVQPDGEQHFKLNSYMGGEEEFEHRKQMDKDENRYLPALGVRVLRIPWFWFDLDNTFILLQDFLGYKLEKPSKDYIPMYKRIKEMVYDYLEHGNAQEVANRYKTSKSTLFKNFKIYFGTPRREYLKSHNHHNQ